MNTAQEQHLQKIKDQFNELVDSKYRKGQAAHGGDLWAKSGLLDMAIEEAIDQVTYLVTLKDKEMLTNRQGRKNICVDIDNTLCYGEAWSVEEAVKAEPRQDIIDRVNELYKSNFICIYTARPDAFLGETKEWLLKHGVRFHAFANGKLGCDVLYDDKAIRPEEL